MPRWDQSISYAYSCSFRALSSYFLPWSRDRLSLISPETPFELSRPIPDASHKRWGGPRTNPGPDPSLREAGWGVSPIELEISGALNLGATFWEDQGA